MPLSYTLLDNPLTERTDDFRAAITADTVVDIEFLVKFLAQRGNISGTQSLAVINELGEALKYFMENGYSIRLPFMQIHYSLSGVFESAADTYDPARHHLNAVVSLGKDLRKVDLTRVPLVKHQASVNQAVISQVLDVGSQKFDSILTPGNMLQVTGNLIKIDGDVPQVGIYFINQETQEETKITFIATNTPKNLILLLPSLSAGEYKLHLITQYSGSTMLKNAKTIFFDKTLTVL